MQLNKLTKEESKVIDILKCIAILSVISAHVIQYSEVNLIAKIASIFWGKFSCIGVVVFFIIGGFLYSRNDGDDAIFWKKKLFRIIIPWMLAAIITYIIGFMLGLPLGVYECFKWVFGSGTWFYYIVVYTFFLLIFKWIYKYNAVLYTLIGIQAVALALASFDVSITINGGFFTDYLNPLYWIGYFSVGILIRRYGINKRIENNKKKVFVVSALLVIASLIFLCVNKINTYFDIVTMIFGVSSTVLITMFAYKMNQYRIATFIGQVGTYSYCIYLWHMQFLQGLFSKIPNNIFETLFSPIIGLIIMIVLIKIGLFICNKIKGGNTIKMVVGL